MQEKEGGRVPTERVERIKWEKKMFALPNCCNSNARDRSERIYMAKIEKKKMFTESYI